MALLVSLPGVPFQQPN